MSQVSVRALRTLAEVNALRGPIDVLNLESRRPCPFSTYEYLETFLAHDEYAATGDELLFLVAFDEGEVIGYLPLRKNRVHALGVVPFTRVGVLISHDTDRPHLIARPEDEPRCAAAMYEHLLEREPSWSVLDLALQDAESALHAVPKLNPLRFWAREFENMPVSRLALRARSVPEYLRGLTGHQRKALNRSVRKTLTAGRAEAISSSGPAETAALLELYLDLEQRSWKAAALAGISRHPERIAFFRALAGPEQPMRLAVHLLLLDDLPVSGAVTGAFGGVMHGLETCFDQDAEATECGHVAVLLAIRQAMVGGLDELNLNGNYAYNKAHFGGVVTPTRAVQLFKVGSPPWVHAQAGELKRRLLPAQPVAPSFNPERRAWEHAAEVRPARLEERESARSVLAGLGLDRLGGAALADALGYAPARKDEVAA